MQLKIGYLFQCPPERIAKGNDLAVTKVGGIPILRFSNNKEGKKTLASYAPRTTLMKVSQKEVENWYENHKIKGK